MANCAQEISGKLFWKLRFLTFTAIACSPSIVNLATQRTRCQTFFFYTAHLLNEEEYEMLDGSEKENSLPLGVEGCPGTFRLDEDELS